jgi:hypothetical protein
MILKKHLEQGLANVRAIYGKDLNPKFVEVFTGGFIAGAYTVFREILEQASSMSDEDAEKHLEKLQKEINEYVDGVLKNPNQPPQNPTSTGHN